MIFLFGPVGAFVVAVVIAIQCGRVYGSASVVYGVLTVLLLVPALWCVFLFDNGALALVFAVCGIGCLIGVFASRKPATQLRKEQWEREQAEQEEYATWQRERQERLYPPGHSNQKVRIEPRVR